jgi:hypothetical protein
MAAGSLISLGGNLEQPRLSKPSDYPAVGPSGPEGSSSGAGKLVSQNLNQEGPQHSQDSGEHTGASWGKAEWTVGVSKGEGGSPSTAVKCAWSVDLSSGQTIPNARDDDKY